MKKIIYASTLLVALGATLLVSCNKLKELAKVNFNLDNADGEFTIPVLTAAANVSISSKDVYLNLDSIIKKQNSEISAANIKEVRLQSCELTLTNGDDVNNFGALESCNLEIASNVKTQYVKMAGVSNNPDKIAQTLSLPVETSLDLKEYFLSANKFSYRISGKSRRATTKELNCKVLVKYTITAGL